MMKFILLLMLVGCAHFNPTPTKAFQIHRVHEISLGVDQSSNGPNDTNVNLYLDLFLSKWLEHKEFPSNAPEIADDLDRLEIHWQEDIFTYDSLWDQTPLEGLTHRTIIKDKILVFVALNDRGKPISLEDSALGHELIHVFLKASTGDGSPDHLGSKHPSLWPQAYEDFLMEVAVNYLLEVGC